MGYENGTEGSQITYSCLLGLAPSKPITATCTSGGNWRPDPHQLMCIGKIQNQYLKLSSCNTF